MADHLLNAIEPFKNIIWDWNGTLLNDAEIVYQVNAKMLEKRGIKPLTAHEHKNKFGFPIRNYYQKIGYDLEKERFEDIASEYCREYDEAVAMAKLFPRTKEVLSTLVGQQKPMAVLSAAEQSHLNWILKRHEIDHFFDHIFGLEDELGHSKVERGMELIEHAGFLREETILVGDTDHDAEVASALGISVLLIAEGHQSLERLQQTGHNHIAFR